MDVESVQKTLKILNLTIPKAIRMELTTVMYPQKIFGVQLIGCKRA